MPVINKSPFPKTDKMGRKVPDGEAKFIDKHEVETVVRDEKTGTASDDTFQAKNIPVTNFKRQSAMTYEQAAVDKVLRIHNNLAFDRKIIEYFSVTEAKMTEKEKAKREEIVRSMKSKEGDFKKKYGKRAKEVMYATATKMAMEGYLYEGPIGKPIPQGTTPTVTPKPNAPAAGTSIKQANPPNVGSLDPIRKDPNVVRDGGVKNTAPAPSTAGKPNTSGNSRGQGIVQDNPPSNAGPKNQRQPQNYVKSNTLAQGGPKNTTPAAPTTPEDNRSQEEIDKQQSSNPQGVAADIKRENILKYKGSAGAQAIQKANPSIKNVNQIVAGQRIKVNGQDYTVKAGDTLDRIARNNPAKTQTDRGAEVQADLKKDMAENPPAQRNTAGTYGGNKSPVTVNAAPPMPTNPGQGNPPSTAPKSPTPIGDALNARSVQRGR